MEPHKPTENILLYAKYARGYRQGGANPTNVAFEVWQPEKVDAYEIGGKASFNSGAVRGYFNIAGYYNKFSNQQLVANGVASVRGFNAQPVVNAGKSRIQRVEVDASATLFQSLRFDLGYSYLDTKLQSISLLPVPNPPCLELRPTAKVGGPLACSPKNRLTLTGTYTLPLDSSLGEISVGATFIHTDKQGFTLATLPPFQDLPATDLVNLNANWNRVLGQPIDLAVFVTNLTNRIYQVAVGGTYPGFGFENLLYAPPRMWGARLRYSFGE